MINKFFSIVSVALLAFPAFSQGTTAGVWYTSSWSSGFTAAENNILRGKVPDPASFGLGEREGSKSYDALTDGAATVRNNKDNVTCLTNNASLIYGFSEGKTVKEVRIYSTWADTGRDTLSVASIVAETVDGTSLTLSPSEVSFSGDGCTACATLKTENGDALCSSVRKIVFNFGAQENGYVGYAELEVVVAEEVVLETVTEIAEGETVTISATPEVQPAAYGMMGGNLVITGPDTVVSQNIPVVNQTEDGTAFGKYWPWGKGVVTVENGATLTSDTELFWGGATAEMKYVDEVRKLVVQSGADVTFTPANGEVCICGPHATQYHNAWVVVTGSGSTLTLPGIVYLGNKNRQPEGHPGALEILDGGYAEMGTLYAGYCGGTLRFVVDSASLKATGGIYCYKNFNRWTGGTFLFRNCVVETPVFQMTYPATMYSGDTVTFDGAVFKPIGTVSAKFIDGPPVIAEKHAEFSVSGAGLIVDSPEGSSLEVSALLQGDGGFTKRGAGEVTLSADNAFTGMTTVESGTLNVTGSIVGGLAVSNGASCVFSSAFTATSLTLPAGSSVSVPAVGVDVGEVHEYEGEFIFVGIESWTKYTPLVTSSTEGFLAKIAAKLNVSETVAEDLEFVVRDGSVQLVDKGIVNGTISWTGTSGDALWSTAGNWDGVGRRIYSGDALVVAAGGASVNDLGQIVLESASFAEGIGSHAVNASGADDSLSIKNFVTNLSESVQTFSLPVSIAADAFSVHGAGEIVFNGGLAADAGASPLLTKTGEGALVVAGATWGGGLDLREGVVKLTEQESGDAVFASEAGSVRLHGRLDAGGAAVTLADDSEGVLGEGAVLENGDYTYVPRSGYNYLALGESQILTLTNRASLTTAAGIFENGTGSGRGVRVLDGSSLVFNNSANAYISSKDNGAAGFLYVSGNSTLRLPGRRTYIAWPQYAGRNGRLDVVDGSSVSGGSIEFGWRATESWFTLTNSVASFSDGLYLDINDNIDYAHSHMFVSGSVVTSALWRVGNAAGKVHASTELVFDDATLVPSKADTESDPYFLCTKPTCDQIKILEGGLAVDNAYDITFNAPLQGEGGFTKLGEGVLTLSSTNAYTGATVVSNGTLRLSGRVAGAINVCSGAALQIAWPLDQSDIPVVPSFSLEDNSSLAVVSQILPEGVKSVDVIRSCESIVLPESFRDEAGNEFFVSGWAGGTVLRYGKRSGFLLIVR